MVSADYLTLEIYILSIKPQYDNKIHMQNAWSSEKPTSNNQNTGKKKIYLNLRHPKSLNFRQSGKLRIISETVKLFQEYTHYSYYAKMLKKEWLPLCLIKKRRTITVINTCWDENNEAEWFLKQYNSSGSITDIRIKRHHWNCYHHHEPYNSPIILHFWVLKLYIF